MKRWMLVMVAGAALLVGCETGVSDSVQPGSEFTADDLTILTVDWRGLKCDLAYIYLQEDAGAQYGTGGPALANLGCYEGGTR